MFAMQENHFERDWFSKPADSLVNMMQRKNLKPSDIAAELSGGTPMLRNLLLGQLAIDCNIARELAEIVGGSASFWLRRQEMYEEALGRVVNTIMQSDEEDWVIRLPVPGSISKDRNITESRRTAIERRLVFFDVNGPDAWARRYGMLRKETRFLESAAFEVHPGATAMWLRQGEIESSLVGTNTWNPEGLEAAIGDIIQLSRIGKPDRFLPRLREELANFGVALAIVRAPEGCRASGAARMISASQGMILLSFRHLSDDHFWFTLLHEIGHLLLHNGRTFIDEEGVDEDEIEREANSFAADQIVPPDLQPKLASLKPDHASVLRFSQQLRIAPGLIVGQMQHKGLIQKSWLNKLRRRWTWDEIGAALP
jgi:HTH-type transcriptional regulator / antitoxin HigA